MSECTSPSLLLPLCGVNTEKERRGSRCGSGSAGSGWDDGILTTTDEEDEMTMESDDGVPFSLLQPQPYDVTVCALLACEWMPVFFSATHTALTTRREQQNQRVREKRVTGQVVCE